MGSAQGKESPQHNLKILATNKVICIYIYTQAFVKPIELGTRFEASHHTPASKTNV
jgi:hypothetical protein